MAAWMGDARQLGKSDRGSLQVLEHPIGSATIECGVGELQVVRVTDMKLDRQAVARVAPLDFDRPSSR
jgi:hypothetical protein